MNVLYRGSILAIDIRNIKENKAHIKVVLRIKGKNQDEIIQCETTADTEFGVAELLQVFATRSQHIFEFDLFTDKDKHLLNIFSYKKA